MKKEEDKPVEKVTNREISDLEHASHSFRLRKILTNSDIDLPYCLNLDHIMHYIEEEIQSVELLLADSSIESLSNFSNGQWNEQRFLHEFEQAFPPTYFALVRANLPLIRKSLNDYSISIAEDRRGKGAKSIDSDSNKEKKSKKSNKKKKLSSKEVFVNNLVEPVAGSTRTLLMIKLASMGIIEHGQIKTAVQELLNCGKASFIKRDLHLGAEKIAYAVLLSEESEQLLSSLQQSLHPSHFDLVLKKMRFVEQEYNAKRKNCVAEIATFPEHTIDIPVQQDSIQKKKRKKIDRPEFISDDCWHLFYDLGRHVSDFIQDAFEVYESGDFANWDNNRLKNIESSLDKKNEVKKRYKRNLVCEHCKKETDAVRKSGVDCVRRVLDLFTDLPKKLSENDKKTERDRIKKIGRIDQEISNKVKNLKETQFRPDLYFISLLLENFSNLSNYITAAFIKSETGQKNHNLLTAAKAVVERVKSEEGRKFMAELHAHLEQAQTMCLGCFVKTGDRDGFFAHTMSYDHFKFAYEMNESIRSTGEINPFFFVSIIVNVLKKEIVV